MSEWDFKRSSKIMISWADFNGYVEKCAEDFEGVHGGMILVKEMQKDEDCCSFVIKNSCVWQTHDFIRPKKSHL